MQNLKIKTCLPAAHPQHTAHPTPPPSKTKQKQKPGGGKAAAEEKGFRLWQRHRGVNFEPPPSASEPGRSKGGARRFPGKGRVRTGCRLSLADACKRERGNARGREGRRERGRERRKGKERKEERRRITVKLFSEGHFRSFFSGAITNCITEKNQISRGLSKSACI